MNQKRGRRQRAKNPQNSAPSSLSTAPAATPTNSAPAKATTATVTRQEFRGPLPRPEDLEHYDQIVPGGAERLFAMAEREAKHRQDIERTALSSVAHEGRLGQILGIVAVVFLSATAVACAYLGHGAAAATIGGGTIVGVVTVFVTGKYFASKDVRPPHA